MGTSFGSLASAAAHFTILNAQMHHVERVILTEACKMIAKRAKDSMGTDGYNWTPLSPNTKKTQPGMLKESGELRDSIHWNVSGNEGHVGSNNGKAVWQELGTSGPHPIPPRSFLVASAQHEEHAITKMAGQTIASMVGGGHSGHSELEQIFHIIKHAAHDLKETAEDALGGNDERHNR
jgi:phage gpG-like protein